MNRLLPHVLNTLLLVLTATAGFAQSPKTVYPVRTVTTSPTATASVKPPVGTFKASQLKNKRVKDAYDTKWPALQAEITRKGVDPNTYDIFLRAFKHEQQIEVWMKSKGETTYKLVKTYAICASSGVLGPKRQEGDGQVPEGFYEIDLFNPNSNYYLSLRVNYPNQSDMILKTAPNAGGAIMIHGNCVTIGCMPITDEYIKELYVLCLEAKNRKRPIYIDIYPCRFTPANIKMLDTYPKDKIDFWAHLKAAYDFFEKNHWLPKVEISKKGKYYFQE